MFSDPVKNLKAFGLRENMIIADLGAGTGFYSIAAAQMVPHGKVYAVDVQKDYLQTISNKAKADRLDNLEILCGNVEKTHGTHIGDSIVDAIIASNILFQIQNTKKFIEEIKRILKPNGKLLLIDWEQGGKIGPHKMAVVPKSDAIAMFEGGGFVFLKDIDAGEHHYGMILQVAP